MLGQAGVERDPEGDPKLAPLADNGGPTKTHTLLAGSPAIDQGKAFDFTTDQRGETRPYDTPSVADATGGDGSDIGAVEVQNDSGNGDAQTPQLNLPADITQGATGSRPPIGVFDLGDVAVMLGAIVLVPFLYLVLAKSFVALRGRRLGGGAAPRWSGTALNAPLSGCPDGREAAPLRPRRTDTNHRIQE